MSILDIIGHMAALKFDLLVACWAWEPSAITLLTD
jgi:hypothetical protein